MGRQSKSTSKKPDVAGEELSTNTKDQYEEWAFKNFHGRVFFLGADHHSCTTTRSRVERGRVLRERGWYETPRRACICALAGHICTLVGECGIVFEFYDVTGAHVHLVPHSTS